MIEAIIMETIVEITKKAMQMPFQFFSSSSATSSWNLKEKSMISSRGSF